MKLANFRKTSSGNWWHFILDGTCEEYHAAKFQLSHRIPEMQLATYEFGQEFRVYRSEENQQVLLETFTDARRCLELTEGQLTMFSPSLDLADF